MEQVEGMRAFTVAQREKRRSCSNENLYEIYERRKVTVASLLFIFYLSNSFYRHDTSRASLGFLESFLAENLRVAREVCRLTCVNILVKYFYNALLSASESNDRTREQISKFPPCRNVFKRKERTEIAAHVLVRNTFNYFPRVRLTPCTRGLFRSDVATTPGDLAYTRHVSYSYCEMLLYAN